MISQDNPVDDASVPPTPESAVRAPNFRATGQAIGDGLADSNFTLKASKGVLSILESWVAWGLAYFLKHAGSILLVLLDVVVKTRAQLDETLAKIASEGISDLFGQDIQADAFSKIGDSAGRKEIAGVLGKQILGGLAIELSDAPAGDIKPSDAPAKAYLTRMAELSVEGWFEEIVTSLISTHPFEKIGEFKERVSSTFGFSRLTRRVLSPAVDILVANPYHSFLNKQYRPKPLSEGHAVELYLRGKLSKEEMTEALARQGYSDTYIDRLITLQEKALGAGEVAFLWLNGAWSYEEAMQYLQERGYSEGIAALTLAHEKQRRIQAPRQEALNAATDSYVHKFIDITEFSKYVDTAILDEDIRHEVIASASARRELNRSHLSEQKAETAVIDGFWTIDQYTEHLTRLGYNDDDLLTMQLLVQEKIAETSDKTTKKKAAAAATATAKQAKLTAAADRQKQLDLQRSHRDLSLAQVHRAYVQGRLTLVQLSDFLVKEKHAPEDIQTLLALAEAEHADYQTAQAKKAKANEKLAVTTLTTSQLEHLVKTGQLSLDDYQSILQKEGVADGDVALLMKAARVDLESATAAKAHRDAVAAKQAEKGLSLAQFEQAVRVGLRTMGEFRKWLADNKYSAADQASLTGLLQDRIDADKAAEEKKQATAAKLQHKNISIAAMEQAVRAGLRPIGDYQQELLQSGVIPEDVHTLVGLLQRKIDDDAAAAKRKAAAVLKAATKGVSLMELERAARLGIVSPDFYRRALAKAGMPLEDQDVMVGLLRADIAKVQAAKAKEAEAAAKLKNKPVTLANLKHSVVLGLRTIDDYKLALQDAGFDREAVDLMGELAQDEITQRQASEKRKEDLDAKRSEKEIARADLEKAVEQGIKTLDDYAAFLTEQGYDEEDSGILYDLLAKKIPG